MLLPCSDEQQKSYSKFSAVFHDLQKIVLNEILYTVLKISCNFRSVDLSMVECASMESSQSELSIDAWFHYAHINVKTFVADLVQPTLSLIHI